MPNLKQLAVARSGQILRLIQKLRQRALVINPGGPPMPGAFIIGAPRSGTTLLRYILDSHSEIAVPPETFLFEPLTECLRNGHTLEALWHLGYQREAVGGALGTSARLLLEGYAKSRNKQRWVEKTPANLFVLPEIATCMPGSKFIMLYRHPFDVIHSQSTSGWSRQAVTLQKRRSPDDDEFVACCRFTADCYRHMGEFSRDATVPMFRLRYEDIVDEPAKNIRALCDFLAVPFEEQMLDFASHRHDAGFGDVNIRSTAGIEDRSGMFAHLGGQQAAIARQWLEPLSDYLPYDLG